MANVHRLIRLARRRRRKRKTYRRRRCFNPFSDLSEQEIFERYRFRRETIYFILALIRPQLVRRTGRSIAVSPLIQLLTAVRFYATGSFYQLVGDSLGLSPATVCRIVHRVSTAIASLATRFIVFPSGERASAVKRDFFQKSGCPHVLGAVDGTFIRIQAPRHNEAEFVNRKGYHSLNVQMTCDTSFMITNCVAKWPGSVHDSRMFRECHLNRQFENGTHNGLLLGDSAYPCKKYLMTPYMNVDSTSHEKYNHALCRARVHIEQCFGILKRRFSCLHVGLRVPPENACVIILACAVLHNIGIQQRDIIQIDHDADNYANNDANHPQEVEGINGNEYRDLIRLQYFS